MTASPSQEQYALEMQLVLLASNAKYFEMYRKYQWLFLRRYFKTIGDFGKLSFAVDVREISDFAHWQIQSERVSNQQLPVKDIFQLVVELFTKPKNALQLLCPDDEMRFMKMIVSNDDSLSLETFDGYQYYSVFSVGARNSLQFDEHDKRFVLKGCRMSDVTSYLLTKREYDINATPKLSNALKMSPAVKCTGNNRLGDELKAVVVFRVSEGSCCHEPLEKNSRPCFLLVFSKTSRKAIVKDKPVMRVKPTPRATKPLIAQPRRSEVLDQHVSGTSRPAYSHFAVLNDPSQAHDFYPTYSLSEITSWILGN
ncbi:uncharacterized protein LOC126901628 [Daktulosphaira vitifoliae]|uniref:uncharacterized protein LOC126901628 n=1 Tax=Daktulosphaira vitifoliae TaxID=58002 RepID=UPI0021A9BF41|nr:uncharacterized protein LOC126901628 [Daktulosphaira vitifoliae]